MPVSHGASGPRTTFNARTPKAVIAITMNAAPTCTSPITGMWNRMSAAAAREASTMNTIASRGVWVAPRCPAAELTVLVIRFVTAPPVWAMVALG